MDSIGKLAGTVITDVTGRAHSTQLEKSGEVLGVGMENEKSEWSEFFQHQTTAVSITHV